MSRGGNKGIFFPPRTFLNPSLLSDAQLLSCQSLSEDGGPSQSNGGANTPAGNGLLALAFNVSKNEIRNLGKKVGSFERRYVCIYDHEQQEESIKRLNPLVLEAWPEKRQDVTAENVWTYDTYQNLPRSVAGRAPFRLSRPPCLKIPSFKRRKGKGG
jgi:hypothetical protein